MPFWRHLIASTANSPTSHPAVMTREVWRAGKPPLEVAAGPTWANGSIP
jgi:hypothetical protein